MSDYRIVSFEAVAEAVADLCGKAACDLPPDVLRALEDGAAREQSELGSEFFRQYRENARIAAENAPSIHLVGAKRRKK